MARNARGEGKRRSDEYAERVAQAIIEQLRQGTAPWTKPWEPGQSRFLPHNASTGKPYRGANTIWLMARQQAEGWTDTRWLTYRQAEKLGAQVRRGEKGTPIQYWMFRGEEPVIDPTTGKPKKNAQGETITRTVEYDRPRVFTAVVFNAAQIDGMPPPPPPRTTPEWQRHERAEAILAASGASITHQDGDRAYYNLLTDAIVLPERGQFRTADAYYATSLHELGHWTGHPSRLDRDMAHPFGSEAYAREELRAEIASLMLGDELGLGHDPSRHVAYVQSWIRKLQEDPKEILRAAADAEKIATYVLELERERAATRDNSLGRGEAAALEYLQTSSFNTVEEAFDDLSDDRSHGDDYLARAAQEVRAEARFGEKDVDAYVREVFRRAYADREQPDIGAEVVYLASGRHRGAPSAPVVPAASLRFSDVPAEPSRLSAVLDSVQATLDAERSSISDDSYVNRRELRDAVSMLAQLRRAAATGEAVHLSAPSLEEEDREERLDSHFRSLRAVAPAVAALRAAGLRVTAAHQGELDALVAQITPPRVTLDGYEPPAAKGYRYHVLSSTADALLLSVYAPGAHEPLGQAEYRILPDGVETTTEAPEFVATITPDEVLALHRAALAEQDLAAAAATPRASAQAPAPLLAGFRAGEYEYDVLEAANGHLLLAAYRDGKSLGTCEYVILADDVQCQGVGYAFTQEINEQQVRALYDAARTRQDLSAAVTPERLSLYSDQQVAHLSTLLTIQHVEQFDGETSNPLGLHGDALVDAIYRCRNRMTYARQVPDQVCARTDAAYWLRYDVAFSRTLAEGLELAAAGKTDHPLALLFERLERAQHNERAQYGREGPVSEPFVPAPARPPLALPVTIQPEAPVPAARVLLAVPYSQRKLAFDAGARFDADAKVWYRPEGTDPAKVASWTPAHQRTGAERTYLDVPFKEKDQASDLGARLDHEMKPKRWFVPPGLPLAAFERWLPREAEAAIEHPAARDPRAEFSDALQAAGLRLGEQGAVMDGTLHRVPVEGDKPTERSGAYKGHLDGHPAGFIQNFRTGEKTNWRFSGRVAQVTPEDRARLQAEAVQKLAERARAREAVHSAAAATVGAELGAAPLAGAAHRYLQRKRVPALGLRIDAKGNLLVPVQTYAGAVVSAQTIRPDGRKGMAKDTAVAGGMYVLQDGKGGVPLKPSAATETILIVEGYATGATVHRATGLPTVVAFNSGNLAAVAQELRKQHPHATLCIAADNDHAQETKTPPKPNVGRLAAEKAAAEVGGHVLLPHFNGLPGSDWNDLEHRAGADFMKMQLIAGVELAQQKDAARSAAAARSDEKTPARRAPVATELER